MPSPHVPADRSALRLSEAARHVVIPEGIVDSLWFEVAERCVEFGDEFDVWQDGLGQAALGIRADGMFAATVGGITLSIPRQVAKTFIVGRICVALCTLYPNLTILWTAHRTRTATKTFQTLKGACMRAGVRGYLRAGSNNGTAIRDTNGEQAIPFANGSEIQFGAREGGFGRGFDEVDVEVFDEAQILTIRALEDMVAATNQSRFERGALLFYMGTPPRPVDPGEMFTERRAEALGLKRAAHGEDFGAVVEAGDAMFVECSADEDVGQPGGPSLDDPRQIEKANPSYPIRTPPVSVKRLRKNLPSNDAWRREGLGVWDRTATSSLIHSREWSSTKDTAPEFDMKCYAVRFSVDGASVALAVGVRGADRIHTDVIAHEPMGLGMGWLVEWLSTRWQDAALILVDGKSGASTLVDALLAAGVNGRRIVTPTTENVIAAHAGFLEAVRTKTATHHDQEPLTKIVARATKRKVGTAGGWAWQAMDDQTDVTPLDAVTWAWWAASFARIPRTRATGVVL